MRLSSTLMIATGLIVALPAFAQGSEEPAAPAPVAEKKICRSIVPTGSIMGKRVCLTKAEWKEFNDLNQEDSETALGKKVIVGPRELTK